MSCTAPQIQEKIACAALDLLAEGSWDELTLPLLSKKTKIPLIQLKKILTTPYDIIPLLIKHIDQRMIKAIAKPEKDSDPADLLFDILMTRFEIMAKNRIGWRSFAHHARRDPKMAFLFYKNLHHSMAYCLNYAYGKSSKPRHTLHFVGAFYFVFIKWCHDISPDSSHTMVNLVHTIQACTRFGF